MLSLSKGLAKLSAALNDRRQIGPLHQCAPALADWYTTSLGKQVLCQQQNLLDGVLGELFGYHLMQLSVHPVSQISDASRIHHCFSMTPHQVDSRRNTSVAAVANFEALPFADEALDVTILHHVLEFSANPHQVLKEAARVTISRGHIIIFAFNPLSYQGVAQQVMRYSNPRSIWSRHALSRTRLQDWLAFLDFSAVDYWVLGPRSPLRMTQLMAGNMKWPLGTSYCLLARKDKAGVRPIKPDWLHRPFAARPGMSEPAIPMASASKRIKPCLVDKAHKKSSIRLIRKPLN